MWQALTNSRGNHSIYYDNVIIYGSFLIWAPRASIAKSVGKPLVGKEEDNKRVPSKTASARTLEYGHTLDVTWIDGHQPTHLPRLFRRTRGHALLQSQSGREAREAELVVLEQPYLAIFLVGCIMRRTQQGADDVLTEYAPHPSLQDRSAAGKGIVVARNGHHSRAVHAFRENFGHQRPEDIDQQGYRRAHVTVFSLASRLHSRLARHWLLEELNVVRPLREVTTLVQEDQAHSRLESRWRTSATQTVINDA